MKQTAVEWLVEQMPTAFKNLTINKKIIQQAKEMDKEQKIEAYIAGSLTGCGCYNYMKKEDGEDYINKTYGGNK